MNLSKPLNIIVDADMLVYASSSSVEIETDWGNDIWTLHSDCGEAKKHFESKLSYYIQRILSHTKHKGDHRIIMALSDKQNFRKELYTEYKANRAGKRKPVCYRGMLQYVKDNYETVVFPKCEGDDVMGYLATTMDNTVLVSGDKDMQCIYPLNGILYNHLSDTFTKVTPESAVYYHYYQTIIGDTTDNYPGIKGVGAVGAKKALDADCSWEAVVKLYESKGLTEADALQQARVAKILDASLWNAETSEVILWQPKYAQECSSECQKEVTA